MPIKVGVFGSNLLGPEQPTPPKPPSPSHEQTTWVSCVAISVNVSASKTEPKSKAARSLHSLKVFLSCAELEKWGIIWKMERTPGRQ